MNFIGKSLVLFHVVLSVAAMTWALWVFAHGRDLGGLEPRKEVLETDKEGNPTKSQRHASEYDKSAVALAQAVRTRDVLFSHVKPALDDIEKHDPFLYQNHLHYLAELKRLREAPDEIVIKRLKEGGLLLEVPVLGRPEYEKDPVPDVKKSYRAYKADLVKVDAEIKKIEDEIVIKVNAVKEFTKQLTGTDDKNEPTGPGLYQLADREFKKQSQIKVEIDELKPYWSQSLEQARQHRIRRTDLESTLFKLKAVAPKTPKKL